MPRPRISEGERQRRERRRHAPLPNYTALHTDPPLQNDAVRAQPIAGARSTQPTPRPSPNLMERLLVTRQEAARNRHGRSREVRLMIVAYGQRAIDQNG